MKKKALTPLEAELLLALAHLLDAAYRLGADEEAMPILYAREIIERESGASHAA